MSFTWVVGRRRFQRNVAKSTAHKLHLNWLMNVCIRIYGILSYGSYDTGEIGLGLCFIDTKDVPAKKRGLYA